MKKIGFFALCVCLFASCVTMQDDVYVDTVSASAEIGDFERAFSALDAEYWKNEKLDAESQKSADALIRSIDDALSDSSLQKAIVARLYAIEGCTAFDNGSKSLAKKCYENSVSAFKGDARALILAHRLGIEKNLAEKAKLFSDKSLLTLEIALTHFSNAEYTQAVAHFDEAFLSLDGFYRDSYDELRNTSWNLRSIDGTAGSDAELLKLQQITVLQMLLLTNQNPDLFFNYTVGKPMSANDLYKKVAGAGLLNPVSQPLDAENAVSKNSLVTKLIAARFLWNLYNHRKNTLQELTKYSAAYKNQKRSPIVDVRLDSPDFDAALGCVENEIMHLEDGIEFGAEKEVSGIEFSESVGKIR